MKVSKGIVCRSRGMIFQELFIERDSLDSAVEVSVTAGGNADMPVKLYCIGGDRFVLCVPVLSVKQVCRIVEKQPNGVSQSEKKVVIHPSVVKWLSRLNYKIRRDKLRGIRNADEAFFHGQVQIEVDSCHSGVGRRLLNGNFVSSVTEVCKYELELYRANGEKLVSNYYIQYEGMEFCGGEWGLGFPRYSFSVDIPMDVDLYVLVVRSASLPSLFSFSVVEVNRLSELVARWNSFTMNGGVDPRYESWFEGNRAKGAMLTRQSETHFAIQPKYSIIVPLYNTPIKLFSEMVESVVAQSYKNWELVLVNSTPENKELCLQVENVASQDTRIKVVELDRNYGITGNTNRGVAVAKGDYIAFFDHDDLIEPDILFEYTYAINQDPDIDVLYCDEDKLYEDGHYGGPYFKSDFSIDLLRNNNYVCHMLTARKTLLDRIGPTPDGYDGAQDHYLILRLSEETKSIHHVPKILYHWRATEGSTALTADNKPYATEAGIRAVKSHLDRLGIEAEVRWYGRPFTYLPEYKIIGNPKVSIIIPTSDNIDMLKKCIDSISQESTYENYEIVVVENNSENPATFEYYKELESFAHNVRVVYWEGSGFNFSSLINYGASLAEGDYLLMLNDDTQVYSENWIETMLGYCQRGDVGAVGLRLYYPDMTYQHAGLVVTDQGVVQLFRHLPEEGLPTGYFSMNDITRNVSAVTGACLMVSKRDFFLVGGLDEDFAVALNDVDFCLKLQARDLLCVFTADASMIHHESRSRGYDFASREKRIRLKKEFAAFQQKWPEICSEGDPYFNKNFSQVSPAANFYALRLD